MRQVLIGDIIAAARSLLELPEECRKDRLREMLYRAQVADKVRKRTGKAHRLWGNGSLMAAAFPKPTRPEPFLSDPDYLDVFRMVAEGLLSQKRWASLRQRPDE